MSTTVSPAAPSRGLARLFGALVFLASVALYAPGLEGAFLYDDFALVEQSPAAQSIGAAFDAFFQPTFGFGQGDGLEVRGIWRPLMSLTLGVGHTLGGGEPFAYHVVSLLLHALTAVVLMRLVSLVLRSRTELDPARAELLAGAAGLVFAVHPSSVEAVAWISAVNDPLWALFGFGALLAYERAALRQRSSFVAPVLVLAALLSKESAIVVPALVLLLDWSARRFDGVGSVIRRAFVLALPVAVWLGLRAYVFGAAHAGLFTAGGDFGLASVTRELTLRLELLGGFVQNALWPADPRFFRPVHPELPEGSNVLAVAGAFSVGILGVGAVLLVRGRRTAAAGLVGFLLVIAPFVVAPDRAGLFPLSDRYLYGALGPLLIGLGALGAARARLAATLGFAAAVPLFLVARGEVPHYADWLAFQDQAVRDAPKSPAVRWATGNAHQKEYLRTEDVEELRKSYVNHLISLRLGRIYGDEDVLHDEDVPTIERIPRLAASLEEADPRALRVDPTVLWTLEDRYQATLGQIRDEILRQRLMPREERDYRMILARIEQAQTLWEGSLGYADRDDLEHLRVQVLQRLGRLDEAREGIAKALNQGGRQTAAEYVELAKVQMNSGKPVEARESLRRATEIEPDDANLWLKLSITADATEQPELALEAIERAYALTEGKDKAVLVQRSVVDLSRGRPTEALAWVDRALEIDGDYGEAYRQRAMIHTLLDDPDRALADWQRTAQLFPEDFVAHYYLASVLLAQEPGEDAPEEVREDWRQSFLTVAIQAYLLAPPTGQEQLDLQAPIQEHLGDDPAASLHLAQLMQQQGRALMAFHWYRRVVELKGGWTAEQQRQVLPRVHTEIGLTYRGAERPDEAIAAFRSALDLDAEHFPAVVELGMLLYETDRREAAEPYLRKALEMLPEAPVPDDMRGAVEATLRGRLAAIEGD